jgi:hypothetical protein
MQPFVWHVQHVLNTERSHEQRARDVCRPSPRPDWATCEGERMNTFTEEQPSLGVGDILAAMAKLNAILSERCVRSQLPEVVYQTSKYAPVVGKDSKPAYYRLPARDDEITELLPHNYHGELIVLHPDNLPRLQEMARGSARLVSLSERQALKP